MENKSIAQNTLAKDFVYDTPYQQGKTLFNSIKGYKKTVLLFLRYYGCTVCQVDIIELKKKYNLFADKGAQVLLILQSEPGTIKEQAEEGFYPFEIICDPKMEIYSAYSVKPASSKLKLASLSLFKKIKQAKKMGLEHGKFEGNELQLPAVFILDPDGKVEYAHYAKNLADMPSFEELSSKI